MWYLMMYYAWEPRVPGLIPPIFAGHFSLFGITAEWPKTTQIAVILSSDGTYNVYKHLRL